MGEGPDPVELIAPEAEQRPVRARHAASLIVLRALPRRTEVLMGMRGARHRFMPNRLVFPGGAVERGDFEAAFKTPLPPDTRRHLERGANPKLAQALAHAAARELEEETGLALGHPPHLNGLQYLCRAVTPTHFAIRFNARFLIVDAGRVSGALAGSGELETLRFYTLAEALALDLASITREILGQLQARLAMTEEQRRARETALVRRARSWRIE